MRHAAMQKALGQLSRQASQLDFHQPDLTIYNPLDYARAAAREYLERYLNRAATVLFVGMNPGPFGMAQTGVPFGDPGYVRDWLGIRASIKKPAREHPRRPVEGYDCVRGEVSGQRLWGLFKDRFGTAPAFFENHFVSNYCPLLFLNERGANVTPDKLPQGALQELYAACDRFLVALIQYGAFRHLIGIGSFAAGRLALLQKSARLPDDTRITRILHPSPASPAANRGWASQATRQLQAAGIWA
ncbi:MAG: hypothetical protein KDK39_11330 [Leptospiraceae bacterium]|nr:hypothetical protein [Leptospiraceae bacterium]